MVEQKRSGQISWPQVGSSVAAYGQFHMAANNPLRLAVGRLQPHAIASRVFRFSLLRPAAHTILRLAAVPISRSLRGFNDRWRSGSQIAPVGDLAGVSSEAGLRN
jgi:hypothetical protein